MNLFRTPNALEKARSLFRKKKLEEAAPFFIKAIEENRDVANASWELGLCFHLQGNFVEAEKSFVISVQQNAANSKAWEMLSLAQAMLEKGDDALISAEKCMETALDREQKLAAKIAQLQALGLLLHKYRPHQVSSYEHLPLEQWKEKSREEQGIRLECERIAKKMLDLISECQQEPKSPKEELWRAYTLVGIYTFNVEISKRGYKELQQLRSRYLKPLIDFYVQLHRYPNGMYPSVGIPEDLHP
jgi:tetratricopeptide (TPR) repeat protein